MVEGRSEEKYAYGALFDNATLSPLFGNGTKTVGLFIEG